MWHKCADHRIDPSAHGTTRGAVKRRDSSGQELMPSDRNGPARKASRLSTAAMGASMRTVHFPEVVDVEGERLNSSLCPNLAARFAGSERFKHFFPPMDWWRLTQEPAY